MKGYSGDDTKKGAFWENNTMSRFLVIKINKKIGTDRYIRRLFKLL